MAAEVMSYDYDRYRIKVAGSNTDEVTGFFSIDLILPAALGSGVYSASNRNEYQELNKQFSGE
jgi:hypothetical protein